MQETLQALGGILLEAIPTVILLIVLHFYLKAILFGPLDKVMKRRRELTEGDREIAVSQPMRRKANPESRRV